MFQILLGRWLFQGAGAPLDVTCFSMVKSPKFDGSGLGTSSHRQVATRDLEALASACHAWRGGCCQQATYVCNPFPVDGQWHMRHTPLHVQFLWCFSPKFLPHVEHAMGDSRLAYIWANQHGGRRVDVGGTRPNSFAKGNNEISSRSIWFDDRFRKTEAMKWSSTPAPEANEVICRPVPSSIQVNLICCTRFTCWFNQVRHPTG